MTTNKNTVNTSTETLIVKDATFAITMDPEHYELVRAAAKAQGVPAAKFGRALILAEAARIMGVEAPVVLESKRGRKGGSKHPLAEKHGLTTVEFNKRLNFHVKEFALSGKKGNLNLDKIDWSVNPFAKPEEVTEPVVEVQDELVVEPT